jgi:uncharacterized membrane protein YgdD (TMEM256/DUF423 family)
MKNLTLIIGSLQAACSVALGAFGAHSLHDFLVATQHLDTFETAAKYQMYGGLALILLGIWQNQMSNKILRRAARMVIAGSFIFPVSLYLICFTGIKWFGAIAPIGGLSYIIGFLLMAYAAYQSKN